MFRSIGKQCGQLVLISMSSTVVVGFTDELDTHIHTQRHTGHGICNVCSNRPHLYDAFEATLQCNAVIFSTCDSFRPERSHWLANHALNFVTVK